MWWFERFQNKSHLVVYYLLMKDSKMKHELPKLAYAYDALEPFIDAQTMEIHYSRHHQAYVTNLNAALEGHTALQGLTVEELLTDLSRLPEDIRAAVRNHGGGHANHSLFWKTLRKEVAFEGALSEAITARFGSYDKFREQFTAAATGLFGSGWAWLTLDGGDLRIVAMPNQDSPLSYGLVPVLGVDVWEHAYYLKYQNRRPEYLEAVFNVLDWEAVNQRFEKARQLVAAK